MRVHSYSTMLATYGIQELEEDELTEREEMLAKFKFSVIVEGDFLEYDTVEKWIKLNLNTSNISFVFYGKIDYNFGFIEYFFDSEIDCERLKKEIPNIYTIYPNGSHSKSDGYDNVNNWEMAKIDEPL